MIKVQVTRKNDVDRNTGFVINDLLDEPENHEGILYTTNSYPGINSDFLVVLNTQIFWVCDDMMEVFDFDAWEGDEDLYDASDFEVKININSEE